MIRRIFSFVIIAAGENMSKFPMDLLGSNVIVEGVISKAGSSPEMATAGKPEAMMAEEMSKPMGADTCVTEKALAKQASLSNIKMDYIRHCIESQKQLESKLYI